MGNRNLTYKWWKDKMANKIVIEKEILDWENPIRGIYGIFIKEKEDVYCAFVYSDGYVTSQGIFDIVHDENEKRYSCSDDYDRIYEEAIEQNETQYRIEQIQ